MLGHIAIAPEDASWQRTAGEPERVQHALESVGCALEDVEGAVAEDGRLDFQPVLLRNLFSRLPCRQVAGLEVE